MDFLKETNKVILSVLIALGVFALLIISHESYHYFAIDGTARGVCFGDCNLGRPNEGHAVGAVYWQWNETQYQKFDSVIQERNAWIFSFLFVLGILGMFITARLKKKG